MEYCSEEFDKKYLRPLNPAVTPEQTFEQSNQLYFEAAAYKESAEDLKLHLIYLANKAGACERQGILARHQAMHDREDLQRYYDIAIAQARNFVNEFNRLKPGVTVLMDAAVKGGRASKNQIDAYVQDVMKSTLPKDGPAWDETQANVTRHFGPPLLSIQETGTVTTLDPMLWSAMQGTSNTTIAGVLPGPSNSANLTTTTTSFSAAAAFATTSTNQVNDEAIDNSLPKTMKYPSPPPATFVDENDDWQQQQQEQQQQQQQQQQKPSKKMRKDKKGKGRRS